LLVDFFVEVFFTDPPLEPGSDLWFSIISEMVLGASKNNPFFGCVESVVTFEDQRCAAAFLCFFAVSFADFPASVF
jgi:hypothetical protein